ncbi:MAG: fibronectin type III domain-containing protein [Clostridia bacterium]|nr:fibronectin type III domain-containing protein [Clostridia bacterium]
MKKVFSSLLAFVMVLALFSGVVIFNASAETVEHHLDFINQYTAAQASKMGKGNGWWSAELNGTAISFSKDAQGRTVITGTTAQTADWGSYYIYFGSGDGATPWTKHKLIDGINPFGDAELSNKKGIAIKWGGDDAFQSAFQTSKGGARVYLNGSDQTLSIWIDGVKRGDYFYYDFYKADGTPNYTATNYDQVGSIVNCFDGVANSLTFATRFSSGSTTVNFWIEDFIVYEDVDTLELHKAIREGKDAGVNAALITAAENIYKDGAATQSQIDAAAQAINDALDEVKFGYEKVKNDLNELLNVADDLGFFDSTYARYEEISLADSVYTDANATFDDLTNQVRIVRDCVAETLLDANGYALFAKCNNAWKYNYTDKSFKALSAAIDEAFAIFQTDLESAGEILLAAYNALEPAAVETVTGNFFDGWTTTMVNDVVDANSGKLCDSIGNGLNYNNVWNSGDFTNNTTFEAENNFSMTALSAFVSGSMGWKNMDRSGTLAAAGANYGYPAIDVTGLTAADGIRLKIEVTGGNVQRLLIGLSNCANMTREQYALNVNPDCVDEEGYINIPFSYFKNAWWCNAFSQNELENVIVLIFEAYGVDEDTKITLSDMRGYKALSASTAADAEKLAPALANLIAFDIDGRYADLIAEASNLVVGVNYTSEFEEAYQDIMAVLKDYKDPDSAIVDVPGFSIYTQEELDMMDSLDGESSLTKTDRGVIYNLPKTSGDYAFVNGIYVPDSGFEIGGTNAGQHLKDPFYGKTLPINGKTFIDMLGGYKLSDIIAYRYQVEGANPGKGNAIHYSNGAGLWHSMLTKKHDVTPDADNWFTYYIDETPIDTGDWYYNDFDLQRVKEETVFAVFEIFDQRGKEMYNWQVILFESLDRSALKEALLAYKGLGIAGYDDAMEVYYDKNATEAQIADAAAALNKAATPEAPAAPTADKVTYNSITLTLGPDNIEYRMGENGEWSGNTEYTGLEPNTEYKFYARVASIGGLPASEPSEALVIKTAKAPIEGEVAVEGEAVYGATLTATANVTTANPGDLTYTWSRGETEVGTGAEYVLGKDDIGATLTVSVSAANLEGVITGEPTAEVVKATPEITVVPVDTAIMIGDKLGNASITGGEASVPGKWSWADPELVPALGQSGTAFPVIFTPEDTDCYNAVTAYVVVNITSDTEEKTIVDDATGIKLTGDFIAGSNPVPHIEDIKAGDPAYLALLRAARANQTAKSLILFKSVTFDSVCYVGTLKLGANIGPARAGQAYTVWFFANGEVCSAQATVDTEGEIVVDGFIADVA